MFPIPAMQVLDRHTGKLVPCNASMCPLAKEVKDPATGHASLVNFAPHSGFAGFAGMVRAEVLCVHACCS